MEKIAAILGDLLSACLLSSSSPGQQHPVGHLVAPYCPCGSARQRHRGRYCHQDWTLQAFALSGIRPLALRVWHVCALRPGYLDSGMGHRADDHRCGSKFADVNADVNNSPCRPS